MAVTPRGSVRIALLVIAVAQLMLVLDDSIVNIALPSIQRSLDVEPVDVPWVVNAYIVVFGSLLLVGGRIGDVWGRRRAFSAGVAVFVAGSLAGGVGADLEMLVAARAVQGLGAALAAPNALALIATSFESKKMRDTALALYGAMSGLGIIAGLLLGGVLTEIGGWRWVFFINVPIGLLVLLGIRSLPSTKGSGGRLGLVGSVVGTAGMVALVYAVTQFGERGLSSRFGHVLVVSAVVLLVAFVLTQARSTHPLLPLGLLRDRSRSGAYVVMLMVAIGPMGTFYVVTLYLQKVLKYSPLQAGLAWLPFAVGIVVGAGVAPVALRRFAPRSVGAVGAMLSAAAAYWLSWIGVDASYLLHLAPAMLLLATGFGLSVLAMTQAAVGDIATTHAGVASAVLNAAQQLGVALGLALLAGVAASVSAGRGAGAVALVDGYGAAVLTAAGILGLAAVASVVLIAGVPIHRTEKETGRVAA